MATEHDPSPIRNKAGERCCFTGVDQTLRSCVVSVCTPPQRRRGRRGHERSCPSTARSTADRPVSRESTRLSLSLLRVTDSLPVSTPLLHGTSQTPRVSGIHSSSYRATRPGWSVPSFRASANQNFRHHLDQARSQVQPASSKTRFNWTCCASSFSPSVRSTNRYSSWTNVAMNSAP